MPKTTSQASAEPAICAVRANTREALQRNDEQFRLLVQGVTDYAIYLLDPDGRVASWNAGAERFKGYQADEILGEHFSRFYTPEDQASGLPLKALEVAAREGRFENEGWRLRKDGTRFWANVVIDPIRERGELIGFAKITRDITERREAQKALEQAQRALFQSQKLESIGKLTGGVAHDFNNLLTAILGSLELLGKRLPDDPKARKLLDNALQGARRGASLTQRMLAFARRQELNPELVRIPDLVEGMRGLFERSVGPDVFIRTLFAPNLPNVCVDANQLETALLNLVVNARDAMPRGGTISIDAAECHLAEGDPLGAAAGRYLCLSVTDTGEGMDDATLQRAMEPFFTTKGVGKGTGLGLSMAHGLAEQSGGKLRLASTQGAGTTVEIWLPAAEASMAFTACLDAPMQTDTRNRTLTIMVVDDDHLVRVNAAAMLEDLGHTVIEADCGAAALDLLKLGRKIDLLITDQLMPGMTGLQLADRVKHMLPELPILLATGYTEQPSQGDKSLPRLAKPFTQAELAEAVQAAYGPDSAPGAGAPLDQETV